MELVQKTITLPPKRRGFHLITNAIEDALPQLRQIRTGLVNVFLLHTSASLMVNENADPDVRRDFERLASHVAPEDFPYAHTAEGPDDMPAHFKASMFGAGVTIPVSGGKLRLGTWQGIYLGEHRDDGGARTLVITLLGEQ